MRLRQKVLAGTVIAVAVLGGTTAHASPDPSPDAHFQALINAATAPCVAGGPTAADTAAAARLNGVLQGKLKNAMTAYRVSCARAVINAVQQRRLEERAAVIAITTTIVESTIMNISEELDHDSLGLFQQRAGWGSETNRLNPTWATNAFLTEMLNLYRDGRWRTAPIGEICQAVQRSAYPDRYRHEVADAQRIVNELGGPGATTVSVYGALGDGRLTYSTINSQTGDRGKTLVSNDNLGFVPRTLATLNFNTLLVTSPGGVLYRVDVLTNGTSLQFNPPAQISGGWTHDMLTYDGHGHLYGIANNTLMSYVVSRDKPGAAQIGQRAVIGSGFTLKNLTATGDDWLLGVSTTGLLRSYRVAADNTWTGVTLADRWSTFDQLVSPGYGLYYGQTRDGALYRYHDHNPYDLSGADLEYFGNDPVDPRGWSQILLSAQPFGS